MVRSTKDEPPFREALTKNADSVTFKGHDYQLETERRMGVRQQELIDELRAENEQKRKDIDYLLERQRDQLARADGLIETIKSAEDAIEQTWRPEVKALRAALNEALAQNERFNTRYRDSEAENERLRARIIMLLRCHYDEHEHHGSPTCFDIQSPTDEWETAALFHVRWTA